eukprot:jgi/Botrbrau1/20062/Bobra.200_1s0066.1
MAAAVVAPPVANAIGAGVTSFSGAFDKVRAGINGIRKARWQQRRLAEELCKIQDIITVVKAEYLTSDTPPRRKGSPVSSAGKEALRTLEQCFRSVEDFISELQTEITGLRDEMENVAVEGNAPCCSLQCCCSWLKACWNALWPPEWVERIPAVSKYLKEVVDEARKRNAFVFGTGFCGSVPKLYIRPQGLYKQVVEHLKKAEGRGGAPPAAENPGEAPGRGGGARGVHIWGGKGTGKSSLARDVAHAFAFDAALSDCYPDGVFDLTCAKDDSVEDLHRRLLLKTAGHRQSPGDHGNNQPGAEPSAGGSAA